MMTAPYDEKPGTLFERERQTGVPPPSMSLVRSFRQPVRPVIRVSRFRRRFSRRGVEAGMITIARARWTRRRPVRRVSSEMFRRNERFSPSPPCRARHGGHLPQARTMRNFLPGHFFRNPAHRTGPRACAPTTISCVDPRGPTEDAESPRRRYFLKESELQSSAFFCRGREARVRSRRGSARRTCTSRRRGDEEDKRDPVKHRREPEAFPPAEQRRERKSDSFLSNSSSSVA